MHAPTNDLSVEKSTHQRELEAYARALVAYADERPLFAHTLYFLSDDLRRTNIDHCTRSAFPQTRWFMPRDEVHAEQRARWLLEEIEVRPEAGAALGIILNWREHFEPKDFVIGIVGLAIMGPTMGLIESKKKPKAVMPVITSRYRYRMSTRASCGRLLQRASVSLLATALAAEGGNAYRLEPDLAEWCFTDQPTRTGLVNSSRELTKLRNFLRSEELPHYALVHNGRLEAVAVSPSVHESALANLGITYIGNAS